MENTEHVLDALYLEASRIAKLNEDIEERGVIPPDHLVDQLVVVTNFIQMIKDEGLVDTVMALVATYPRELLEMNFTVFETCNADGKPVVRRRQHVPSVEKEKTGDPERWQWFQ